MRLTDVFLSIPPLVLAMSIMGFLEPSAIHGMMAVTAMWWPWYARLAYNLTRAEKQEGYVLAAETVGAGLLAHPVPRDPAQLHAVDLHQDDASMSASSS